MSGGLRVRHDRPKGDIDCESNLAYGFLNHEKRYRRDKQGKILRHLKLWDPPERSPSPGVSRTLEAEADFLAWEATRRLFDGIG
jgi:hypothetical protein